ncbi:RNA-binding protein Musashi homolog 1-like [Belonocnema kinseyi]|uniref:RNA-binding protein Musashi homolog 1-like n=1 Tax=Belonocnema kinseyi TaxID=2817044 RepID=UPI00143CE3C7|nr:RNA-binding protein Musashi homolog 1-like [Belonocnema kinseyi]XP_033211087.1 RNA-binding protein Musashi homolog 1-like [Belonocnema kinseyi]
MTKKVPKTYVDGDEYYDPYYVQVPSVAPTQIVSPAVAKNSRTLQVSANPSELTDSEVVNYFTQFGPIEEVTTPFDKTKNKWKGFLYIVFESAAIVNQLIKTPTKLINGKKVLVAKKSADNSANGGLNSPNFATTTISAFSSIMPASFSIPSNISMLSTAPLSSATLGPSQSYGLQEIMIPISALPMSATYPYEMPSVSGYHYPSESEIAGPSGMAGPSGLGGTKKK